MRPSSEVDSIRLAVLTEGRGGGGRGRGERWREGHRKGELAGGSERAREEERQEGRCKVWREGGKVGGARVFSAVQNEPCGIDVFFLVITETESFLTKARRTLSLF